MTKGKKCTFSSMLGPWNETGGEKTGRKEKARKIWKSLGMRTSVSTGQQSHCEITDLDCLQGWLHVSDTDPHVHLDENLFVGRPFPKWKVHPMAPSAHQSEMKKLQSSIRRGCFSLPFSFLWNKPSNNPAALLLFLLDGLSQPLPPHGSAAGKSHVSLLCTCQILVWDQDPAHVVAASPGQEGLQG